MNYKDQLNRKLLLKETPKRIVSLVPSQTELLVDLGLEDLIVGVTKFCIHPNHLRVSKTIVGGTKQVNIQKIKDLQPDIILCNKEENTKHIIEELKSVAQIHISDIYHLEDCFELIKMYGTIFKVEEKALAIINAIKKERKTFQSSFQSKSDAKVAYFIWKDPWMVAASDTFVNYMIKEAGFVNVFENETRYPEVRLDNVNFNQTHIIFLSSEPYPFKEEHVLELKSHFPQKIIKVVDGELFSWYGSRLQKSFKYFGKLHKSI